MGCSSSSSRPQTTRDSRDPKDRRPSRANTRHSRNSQGTKYVAVVGRTGSGMSQFIHDATGKYERGVGSETTLRPYTRKITQAVEFEFQNKQLANLTVVLIDTPGFDYSDGNDEHVRFNQLGKWFQTRYGQRAKLDGIIYMHNIWNAEAYHRSPLLTCQALEDLCGQDWRRKVIFVNSHWSEGITHDGEEREKSLRAGYWRFMLLKGSAMERYESPGNRRKAQKILQELISR